MSVDKDNFITFYTDYKKDLFPILLPSIFSKYNKEINYTGNLDNIIKIFNNIFEDFQDEYKIIFNTDFKDLQKRKKKLYDYSDLYRITTNNFSIKEKKEIISYIITDLLVYMIDF